LTLTPGMLLLHEKYRVESLLGAGAFAQVYRVLHLQLNVPRALKILHRDAAGLSSTEFGDYRTRFELEAQLGAQLHHPHVIGVHDFEEADGTLMLVMELAPGGSLAGRIMKARSEGHPLGVVLRLVWRKLLRWFSRRES
jgi:serine/threonine protein kinase